MSTPAVVVHADARTLADAVAARLVTRLVDVQSARGHADIVLTGGTIGIATLAAVAASSARDAVDWAAVDIWWGDERFLPAGDGDRNATQAYRALLDHVPVSPANVHVMPPSDGPDGADVDAAARRYAEDLQAAAARHTGARRSGVPEFDVLMLGVGPDGHVASLFPGHPALYVDDATTVGVRGSPKPPPVRISLTMSALSAAQEVWFVVSGADKAPVVRLALTSAGELAVPAAGPRGRRRTLWLLDRTAAAQVPPQLIRLASP